MTEEDYSLVTSRVRRANAGSRLRQLIELEEQSTEGVSLGVFSNEDDENVNLLFQEAASDDEYEEDEDEEGSDASADEVTNTDHGAKADEDVDEEEENTGGDNEVDKDTDNDNNNLDDDTNRDDILSDSDISASDSDESEGERELQNQERRKKRLDRKKNLIPTIKTPKTQEQREAQAQKQKQKKSHLVTSDILLYSERRSSSRSSAVNSKQALVKKLKESEERRAKFVPVVRTKEVQLTQEDRLKVALETEKANIIALNQFKEQEIVKKERQKQLLLARRQVLTNVIRYTSEELLVYPWDEIKDARHVRSLFNKPKRRIGRRKKLDNNNDNKPEDLYPGAVDTSLPYYKQEMEQKAKQEQLARESEQLLKMEVDTEGTSADLKKSEEEASFENKQVTISEGLDVNEHSMAEEKSTEKEKNTTDEIEVQEVKLEQEENGEAKSKEDDGPTEADGHTEENRSKEAEERTLEDESSEHIKEDEASIEEEEAKEFEISTEEERTVTKIDTEKPNIKSEELSNFLEMNKVIINVENEDQPPTTNDTFAKNEEGTDLDATESEGKRPREDESLTEGNGSSTTTKRVKFEDEIDSKSLPTSNGVISSPTPTPTPPPSLLNLEEQSEVFEGPPQRICRNLIYLVDFDETHRLDSDQIRKALFGEQALLPASRRFKDLKTIVKISQQESAYVNVPEVNDPIFESAKNLSESDPLFSELKRLPRLGDTETMEEEVEEDTKEVETQININTQAPTGLYLPNGSKKVCLISGTEVKYFDPATGIPYGSVEVYRLLKGIEQGHVPWYSISASANDEGGGEIYLGSREGPIRHAKGVPEGFDG
ncbi:uncharacterized protein KQ657_000452 [Scheffersomyces spartinae]|uniref:Vps72/YL1 C-terminal domain-containing protein n=1 Tax=Scheffersomyces spartinae TaxID=45513 RepID=A0A9P7V9H5_9ASCO|nr:uncharacterized protein KQ657_000452 [Scheffersomyces spartinae]KAG7193761.1 hypothetical protein KQ657_000452 [Scheffersomyces spartinae]